MKSVYVEIREIGLLNNVGKYEYYKNTIIFEKYVLKNLPTKITPEGFSVPYFNDFFRKIDS